LNDVNIQRSFPGGHRDYRAKAVASSNRAAAIAMADAVRTMIGPKGMSKLLVSEAGDYVATSDGGVFIMKMKASHPIALMLKDASVAQLNGVGGGIKSLILLVGELVSNAEKLMPKMHPKTIIEGYKESVSACLSGLANAAFRVTLMDETALEAIAMTAMCGKAMVGESCHLAKIAVELAKRHFDHEMRKIDLSRITIRKVAGKGICDTSIVDGIVISKRRPFSSSPSRIENTGVVLVSEALGFTRESSGLMKEYVVTAPSQLKDAFRIERANLSKTASKLSRLGGRLLFSSRRIYKTAFEEFAKAGISAFELTGEEDLERISKCTGAAIVSDLDDLKEGDLGGASLAEFRRVGSEELLFIYGSGKTKTSTVILRGAMEQTIEEAERGLQAAMKSIELALVEGAVGGGGSIEIELSKQVRELALSRRGKEQLAMDAFADALDSIPIALASSTGASPLDIIPRLRALHQEGVIDAGYDASINEIVSAKKRGIIEPLALKRHTIRSAYEVSAILLNIGDAILISNAKKAEKGLQISAERERLQQEKVSAFLKRKEELKEIDRQLTGNL